MSLENTDRRFFYKKKKIILFILCWYLDMDGYEEI